MKKNINRKGIILAGGLGNRLYPITLSISKQILPVYDKPMIYYPLSTLMLSDIKDILIISSSTHIDLFKNLLNDGSDFGIKIKYQIQEYPKGIAQALLLAKKFVNKNPFTLILGDNIFYGNNLQNILIQASDKRNGATIFGYRVTNPKEFGIVEFDKNNKVKSIVEKPKKPKSDYAVTGLYFYDYKAINYAEKIKPSKRGELEITDINNLYLKNKNLNVIKLNRGFSWLDTGTSESLIEAGKFVEIIEKRQGLKISCPEEIAYKKKWISKTKIIKKINKYGASQYSNYLKKIINEEII